MSIKDILEMKVDRTKISIFSSFEESEKAKENIGVREHPKKECWHWK